MTFSGWQREIFAGISSPYSPRWLTRFTFANMSKAQRSRHRNMDTIMEMFCCKWPTFSSVFLIYIYWDKCGDWRKQRPKWNVNTEQREEMKLEWLCKVGSESELNSLRDSSVGWGVWMEFSGCWFKSHSGQLSIATSRNPSVVNTICINSFRY